jgi:ligand-binding SRPBCC domain-containing protein
MVTIEEVTRIRAPIERCYDLARSVEVHLAGNLHCGETAVAAAGVTTGLIGLSQHVTWRAKHFGLWHTLTSQITAMNPPNYFQDVMTRGIFRFMRHDHFFRALSSAQESAEKPAETEMRDVLSFAAPLPLLGRFAEITFLRRYMQALLHERNAMVKTIAESSEWTKYLP